MWSGDFVGSPLISEYIQNIIKHESLKCLKDEKVGNGGKEKRVVCALADP